jgi:tetratricopeptide (TPR) repeat protein
VRDVIIDAHLILGLKYMEQKEYQKALENFTLAQVPEEEASASRAGNRNIQVYYLIGLANEALKSKSKAKRFFTLSSEMNADPSGYISYYKGMSCLKLGKKTESAKYFNAMLEESDKQLNQQVESDFFDKFGGREAENARLSNAYLLKGLAFNGLGNTGSAMENLRKAVELSESNLWAKSELHSLSGTGVLSTSK